MRTIAILGCGWLGLPLGKTLIQEGYEVRGSTTTEEKIKILQPEGIEPFLIDLSKKPSEELWGEFLKNIDVLILDTPPLSKNAKKVEKIYEPIVEAIQRNKVPHLLLTSSTGVFADTEDFKVYTEETPITPHSERSQYLIAIERFFIRNQNFDTTITRFGGLYGDDRHPAKYLTGRSNVQNPYAPMNMTSQNTAIEGILKLIKAPSIGTYHLLEKTHPNRKSYYTEKCRELGLTPPIFSKGKSVGKFVGSLYF